MLVSLFLWPICCCCSVAKSCLTLCDPIHCSTPSPLSFTISQSLLKFMSIELVTLSNHLILYHPLPVLPSIFSSIRVFSNELALCIRWPKYWSCSFNINPSNECSRLISFRMGWFDLLAVQETLKSFFGTIILKHQFLNTQFPNGHGNWQL